MPSETRFLASFFHAPSQLAEQAFVGVLRAGHLQAGSDYRVERRVSAGHDLLLAVRGAGTVLAMGRQFRVSAGELAWIHGAHPHAHWADPADPWELLWLRIDGPSLEPIAASLGIDAQPVFSLPAPAKTACIFRRTFDLMNTPPPALEALLHREATSLIATLFEVRQDRPSGFAVGTGLPPAVRRTTEQMSLYYFRPWRIEELARRAGISVPQYFRCFKQATGLTPMCWLRRERMHQAKRRLTETADSIKEIAEQVGYGDQFHFSRDFRRSAGVSPSQFRRHEVGAGKS
jgi:AraC-like DNA-binding protein